MIKEVNKSDVLRLLVNGVKVFRINTNNLSVADIEDKSINVIKRDLEKDEYIYFTLVNVEINHENPFRRKENVPLTYADTHNIFGENIIHSVEEKRDYIKKFCDEIDRCNETCPLFKVTGAGCYSVESDEIIEKHYDLVREYERNEPEV